MKMQRSEGMPLLRRARLRPIVRVRRFGRAFQVRRADPHDVMAILPGLINEIGPSLHQLPPQRQRIATPVVTFNTRHHVTKRCLGDFALYTVIAAPVPEG